MEFTKVPFDDKRNVKLKKCHYINGVASALKDFAFVFCFDADCVVASEVAAKTVEDWFSGAAELVGVMHPWPAIRDTNRRFEKDPASAAYVAPEEAALMPYHQSCFWGGKAPAVLQMCEAVETIAQQDVARGCVNEFLICDEIYCNRYFLSNRSRLHSLDTEFAHPGDEYEAFTARGSKPGYRFDAAPVVVHDNAHQTKSWQRSLSKQAFFTYGAYLQFSGTTSRSNTPLRAFGGSTRPTRFTWSPMAATIPRPWLPLFHARHAARTSGTAPIAASCLTRTIGSGSSEFTRPAGRLWPRWWVGSFCWSRTSSVLRRRLIFPNTP